VNWGEPLAPAGWCQREYGVRRRFAERSCEIGEMRTPRYGASGRRSQTTGENAQSVVGPGGERSTREDLWGTGAFAPVGADRKSVSLPKPASVGRGHYSGKHCCDRPNLVLPACSVAWDRGESAEVEDWFRGTAGGLGVPRIRPQKIPNQIPLAWFGKMGHAFREVAGGSTGSISAVGTT